MSNDIKIHCPKCRKEQSYSRVLLVKTKGHVICKDCQHMFQVVKKPKANRVETDVIEHRPSAPAAPDSFKAAPAAPNIPTYVKTRKAAEAAAGKPAAAHHKPIKQPEKTVAAQVALHKKQAPLNYRVPLLEKSKQTDTFAEVGKNPFAFNLVDRDSVKMQLPQVVPQGGAQTQGVPSHASLQQGEQQNNITIHTDSLVFTLMGDQSSSTLPQTQSAAGGGALPPAAHAPHGYHEMNWTIATIAALIMLIIQLFCLSIMMQ